MAELDPSRLRDTLSRTIGPTPWYWQTFPVLTKTTGQRLVWHHQGIEGPLGYLVTLGPEEDSNSALLALNTYCRPFPVGPTKLGIWCPEGRALRLVCFDLDTLKPFDVSEVAGWFKQSADRIFAHTPPMADFEVPLALEPGTHKIVVPAELATVEELIVPTSYKAMSNDEPAFALFIFYLHAGLVEVLPQQWFTASRYQVGRQWITRALRDTQTHRIFGECFGAGIFLLEEDGCRLEGWLEESEEK